MASNQIEKPAVASLPLADRDCSVKLNKLTKAGGTSDKWALAAWSLLLAAIAFAFWLFLRSAYNDPELDSSTRGWARLAYWLTVGAVPAAVLAAVWNAVRALQTQVSSTFVVRCPRCQSTHEISAVHRRGFELNCSACYALIRGRSESHSTKVRCDYCELEHFDAHATSSACPSCGRKPGPEASKCPQCSRGLPKKAICCVHCDHWLRDEEAAFGNYAAMFDLTRLSSKVARVYALEVDRRLDSLNTGIEELLGRTPQVRDLDPGTRASIGSAYHPMRVLLHKIALAAEWMRRPRGEAVDPLPTTVANTLERADSTLRRLDEGGLSMREERAALDQARRSLAG